MSRKELVVMREDVITPSCVYFFPIVLKSSFCCSTEGFIRTLENTVFCSITVLCVENVDQNTWSRKDS
ncbi:hypothetical protein GN956_G7591 [Arapaima gigas]